MKWLFLSEHEGFGGVESRCRALARALLQFGHRVDLACFEKNIYHDLLAEYPNRCRLLTVPNRIRHSLDWSSLVGACNFLRKCRPDAMFFCTAELPRFLPFVTAGRITGVRYNIIHHANYQPYLPPNCSGKRYLGGLIRGIGLWRKKLIFRTRFAYRNVSHALFNTEAQQREWVSVYGYENAKKGLWLPPLDLSRFTAARGQREKTRDELGWKGKWVIGSAGRFDPCKSFDTLLRAFAIVRQSRSDAALVLVGDGPERERLVTLANELQMTDQVAFTGAQRDVSRYVAALDNFVLPSINESLGIAIVEAMVCGVPVIVTDLPGPRQLVDQGAAGLVVPPGDAPALADAIIRLANDSTTRRRFVQTGLEKAQQCDYRVVTRTLLEWLGCGRDGAHSLRQPSAGEPLCV